MCSICFNTAGHINKINVIYTILSIGNVLFFLSTYYECTLARSLSLSLTHSVIFIFYLDNKNKLTKKNGRKPPLQQRWSYILLWSARVKEQKHTAKKGWTFKISKSYKLLMIVCPKIKPLKSTLSLCNK